MKDKQQQDGPRCAEHNCACNKCFKPKREDEAKAKAYWIDLYNRMGWEKDKLGYL